MNNLTTGLVFLISLATGMLTSALARADQYYPFIKVDCNKVAQTFAVSMYAPQKGDDPEHMLADVRAGKLKNMYYLIDIAHEPKQRVKCDLGKGQVASFIGGFDGSHMANDGIGFRLNNMPLGSFFISHYDNFLITALNANEAVVKACPTVTWAHVKTTIKIDENGCAVTHIINGTKVAE